MNRGLSLILRVTKAARGKGTKPRVAGEEQEKTPAERRTAMTWAQRLKRVFHIDIETWRSCGGALRIIACIEDPAVIKKILDHLKRKDETREPVPKPESRAPLALCSADATPRSTPNTVTQGARQGAG